MDATTEPESSQMQSETAAVRTISSKTVEGNDGICFTAGPEAAVIGAGTIHAYLAARRTCPKVAAGISLGALNAAAMQRAYREATQGVGKTPPEETAARWTWFRQYVETLAEQPFNVLWNAIPDQSDFFADMIPIRDTSLPVSLRHEETEARRRLYLLVKLGRWLAQLPVSVSQIARGIVNYVRLREKYPLGQRVVSLLLLLGNLFHSMTRIILHLCLSPQFFPEHKFREPPTAPAADGKAPQTRFRCRVPVVAWLNLCSMTLFLTCIPLLILVHSIVAPPQSVAKAWQAVLQPTLVSLCVIGLTAAATAGFRRAVLRWQWVQRLLLPLLGLSAYAFSLGNAFGLSGVLISAGCMLYLYAFQTPAPGWVFLASVSLLFSFVVHILFAPVVLLPETRQWLGEHGFFQQWPRPLFGWVPFLFLWGNVVGLVAYLTLGGYFLVQAIHTMDWFPALLRALIGTWDLFLVLALPLIPLFVPLLLWRKMKRIATARTGWHRAVAWGLSTLLSAGLVALGTRLCTYRLHIVRKLFPAHWEPWTMHPTLWRLFIFAAFVLMLTWLVIFIFLSQPVLRRWLSTWVLAKLGIERSLIHTLHLQLKLLRLFDPHWAEHKRQTDPQQEPLSEEPMPAILVAASLQTLGENGRPKPAYQLWAKPGTPILHALECALAVPPLFPPVHLQEPQLRWWLKDSVRNDAANKRQLERGLDLVDGSVIRRNPMPALYNFLNKTPRATEMVANNSREHPAIHVVYGVPIEGRTRPPAAPGQQQDKDCAGCRNNIVDVGIESLRLSHRRDTQLEVLQTNLISRLESVVSSAAAYSGKVTHAIYADEIAPEQDLRFQNPLNPTRQEILQGIAVGCRRSLETLYQHELVAVHAAGAQGCSVHCPDFLVTIGRIPSVTATEPPGLPEVCAQCPKELRPRGTGGVPQGSTASVQTLLSEGVALCQEHPQLSGAQPRIVFVASGGVFRGAFHIGMLGALHSCQIKPDLIVGTSVGTLMGGALGALFCQPHDVLGQLVDAFLRVDETVALTRTLKSAAREIGIRGRVIHLSPRRVRRMVRRGARSDSGFAATGSPPALIDAISDLFMIPHVQTREIAVDFISGAVTSAVNRLITQLHTETIQRLDIEKAVIGTTLLEDLVFNLFTDGTAGFRLHRQPFQKQGIAFYGTTTNLCTHSALLLGGKGLHPGAPYDFVEAALASSAFPAVFAPRPESQVFPGTGRADVFFADGGMFDNLPFLPTIEILARAQHGYRACAGQEWTILDFLLQRLAQPDLLIAGALDVVPEFDENARGPFHSVGAICRRANALKNNVKIRTFEQASQRVYSQLQRLAAANPAWLGGAQAHFVDRVVNAAVLPVFPDSPEHLNSTFAFCAATGLNRKRVQKSIADGCFQTLRALARQQKSAAECQPEDVKRQPELLTAKSVQALTSLQRIPVLESLDTDPLGDHCPYFGKDGQRFVCPFAREPSGDDPHWKQMRGIFMACQNDIAHQHPGKRP